MGTLQFILGLLFFFLPGFLLTKNKDWGERIFVSMAVSWSIIIVIGFVLAFFGVFTRLVFWTLLTGITMVLLIHFLKKPIKKVKNGKILIVLFLIFITVFFIIFNVHAPIISDPEDFKRGVQGPYPLPYHFDEWTHIAQVRYVIEEKTIVNKNPYFFHYDAAPYYSLENGFHIFLAAFYFMTWSIIEVYQFLPALFTALSACFLFLLARKLYNTSAGLFSVVFFTLIKSNVNILGNWFFVPSSFSVFFLFAALFFLIEKKWNFLALTILATALTYPPLAVLLVVVVAYTLIKDKRVFLTLFVLGSLFTFLTLYFTLPILTPLLNKAFFAGEWAQTFHLKNAEFSFLLLFLGLYGAFTNFTKKKYEGAALFTFLTLFMLFFFSFFSFTVYVPAVRAAYYFQIILSLFAGIVLAQFVTKLPKKTHHALMIGIFILLFSFQFYNYHHIEEEKFHVYQPLTKSQYSALKFFLDKFDVVMADPLLSPTIYPLVGNNVVAVLSANLGGGNREAQHSFYTAQSCQQRKEVLDSLKPSPRFVITQNPLSCSFFQLLIKKKDIFIYAYPAPG